MKYRSFHFCPGVYSSSFNLVMLILKIIFYPSTAVLKHTADGVNMSSGKQQTEWGWSPQEPHKQWYPCTKLYGITSQNAVMFTWANVKTSNMSSYFHFFILHSNLTKASVSTTVYMIITIPNLRSDDIKSDVYAEIQRYERKKEVVFLDLYQYLIGVALPGQMLQLPLWV